VSKRSVFAHYLEACKRQNVLTPISHTYFGKLVRKAFPDVRCNRKGPRGSAQQHYRLIRADGGDADEFLSAHFPDEVQEEADEEEEEYTSKRAKRNARSSKKATTAAALRKNGVSRVRVRAAATAAASSISRMISADQAPANLTEAWSFSSAPSSPSFSACQSTAASIPSSPAQHYAESEDSDEEEYVEEELVEAEEYAEEEEQEEENEEDYESDATGGEAEEVELNFDLPQFEITPGEESPGTSFSYEACPTVSGHEQNLRLQQQLQHSTQQQQPQFAVPQQPISQPQHQQQLQQPSMTYFEPSAFYDFVSPDLEMPLSAINQVNLAEDFGWSMPSMPSAVDNCASAYQQHQQQQHYYQQQQQQQSSGVHSYLLSDQLPSAQCSDLAEWVSHYCI
jgi:hypothetical protein